MSAVLDKVANPDITSGAPVSTQRKVPRLAAGLATTAVFFIGGTGSASSLPAAAAQGRLDNGWTQGSVILPRPVPNVRALRERTDLSWQQIADVAGVSRRAVHYWDSGAPMSELHAERLTHLEVAIQHLEGRRPEDVREYLLAPDAEGSNPLRRLIAAHRAHPEAGPSQVDLLRGGGDVQGVKSTKKVRRGRTLKVQPRLG